MTASRELVVALDVGGTAIKAGLVDGAGRIVAQAGRDTPVAAGVDATVEAIGDLARFLILGALPDDVVRAVGVGVPGLVDSKAGIARYAANLGWRELPLTARLAERLNLPVALGHDVRNAALAEARLGADAADRADAADPARPGSLYFVSIGTGIAAALVEDGVVSEGSSGQAGELGHLVVRPGGPECGCGNRGCLEAIASASRIARRFAEVTGAQRSAREVAGLVADGVPAALRVWSDAVAALADALAAVTVLADPGKIVLGGGLSLAGETLAAPLRPALAARLTFRAAPPISLTRLGDRAGLIGAGLRAWDVLDDELGSE